MPKGVSFRILLFCLYIPVILLMSGCADDLRNRKLFDCGAGDAVISYSVADVILTRDGDEEDFESLVDHAYLLFYASDASARTDVPVAAVRAESENNGLKFKMPISLQPNTDYHVIAIANADSYTPSGYNNYGAYLEVWCSNQTDKDYSPIQFFYDSQITPGTLQTLPMSGEIKDGSVFRFSEVNGVYNIPSSLSFRRKVARIDVANIVRDGFNVEGVYLCNWRDAVDAYPSEEIARNKEGALHGLLSKESASEEEFILMPKMDIDGIQRLNKSIYCFPSVSYESYSGDEESTALIIKAKYGQDTESTYYRVNVGTKGNISEVKANTKYLVTIQSVKGSGAPTPEEAYAAKESPIVLSIVEDWDIEGGAFDIDDYGNFIVLSKSRLDFAGYNSENVEVRILTSKGLNWRAEYVASDAVAEGAFKVEKISDVSLSVSPSGKNESDKSLTGVCRVSALTSNGSLLKVDLPLFQEGAGENMDEPVIPDDMPFALVLDSYDRVKINHIERKIEIDGFDPDCFNSFIDIPFTVYVKESIANYPYIMVSSDLDWPLEGCISTTNQSDFFYCSESFTTSKSVYSKKDNKILNTAQVLGYSNGFMVPVDRKVFITIGAMAPDDPSIIRKITIESDKDKVEYTLEVKPRPIIMDDVVLTDENSNKWLIFDRNVQHFDSSGVYDEYIGRAQDGHKWQAYNYFYQGYDIKIPNKYDGNNFNISELTHYLYLGNVTQYKNRADIISGVATNSVTPIPVWLANYSYNDESVRTSPFYEISDMDKWKLPTSNVLDLCKSKMRVSKMRMFLMSEVPAKTGKKEIPICCYWPYFGNILGMIDSGNYGYYNSDDSVNPTSLVIIYHNGVEMKSYVPSSSDIGKYSGISRLVRQLSDEELSDYKQNYLGYGSQPSKLSPCHPDTYTSDGWIPY